MSLTLVVGGTRSGKSEYAERLALASGSPVRYVATADAGDASMADRIAAHRARRPSGWATVEAAAGLAVDPDECVLVDGLGLWIATTPEVAVEEEIEGMAAAASQVIVVAEQAGEGMLPLDALSRAWLDRLGEATQRLAAAADRVVLVIAGQALELKAPPPAGVPRPPSPAGLRVHGDTVVRPGDADHAVNVLAGGPPAWLRAALAAALDSDATSYPREDRAVAAVAARHGRAPEEIVPTNGAAEALWLLPAALRPRLAAIVNPGFTEAEAALRAHNVPVVSVVRRAEDGFALDPRAVPEAADLVIAGNPASPCGTLTPAATLLALRRPGRVLVVDEAFMDMVPGEPATLVRDRLEDVVVVRSLTKLLAIPGLRAGYAVAAEPVAARLRAVRPPWSANALALAALTAAAERPADCAALARRAQEERSDLDGRLARIDGLRRWPGAANYCLVEVPDGPAVLERLRAARIAVRPAGSFTGLGPGHLRLTARGPKENERLATALAEAVAACR